MDFHYNMEPMTNQSGKYSTELFANQAANIILHHNFEKVCITANMQHCIIWFAVCRIGCKKNHMCIFLFKKILVFLIKSDFYDFFSQHSNIEYISRILCFHSH